ncbi:MAG: sulfur globule family protein [Candidatus Thiodiazotropha sp. (ex Monitilora ramsayi)]|nr:sulfur globule family protein [Candidatus Thiodiazotropha sp. (ex Monitilora ramsayi)]
MKIHVWLFTLIGSALLSSILSISAVMAQPYGYDRGYGGRYGPPPSSYPRKAPQASSKGSVKILNPKPNEVVSSRVPLVVKYDVDPGPRGDHVHVYLNGREVAILRQLKGEHNLGRVRPGAYEVAIKVVNRQHVPIGIEQSVAINVR